MERLPADVYMKIFCLLDHQNLATAQQVANFVSTGLKIIREGDDCYLIHQGEIQRHLGSRTQKRKSGGLFCSDADFTDREDPCSGILDKMLFFLGDLEAASGHAKRSRLL
ncbi:hypothetical protein RJ639_019660 [Escallonia herrerae]|uniref:F-box protein n=1 Tax=Escallonia herrerae TaxID=1293975 RepID=A0AA88V8T2_9ASTE|nr:hypothetical protein RJ639_019660 [Escallonia herrerae]